MAPFDADEGGDLPRLADADDVVGRAGELEVVRIGLNESVNDVDLFEGELDARAGLARTRRHVSGPELRAYPSLAEPRNVRVQSLLRPADINRAERQVVLFAELVGEVVVPVHDQRLAVDRPRLVRQDDRLPLRSLGKGKRWE